MDDANLEDFFSFVLLFIGACLSPLFPEKLDKALDAIYIFYTSIVLIFVKIQNFSNPHFKHFNDAHKMAILYFVPAMDIISLISLALSIANIKWNNKILRISNFCLSYIIVPGAVLFCMVILSFFKGADFEYIDKYMELPAKWKPFPFEWCF
ncbi:6102_t:CDS:2 [Entrophospora sp. SA101]|nr:6102_t:CDS:2 [Entrophospora sp. SA101]